MKNKKGIDPRTNEISNLLTFIKAWQDPIHQLNKKPVVLFRTKFGNINETGELGNYTGHALTKWHPQFRDSIEENVRDLVLLLAYDYEWITYTSCEGHFYNHFQLRPVERHIGLIPRNKNEKDKILSIFQEANDRVNREFFFYPIRLEIVIHSVRTNQLELSAIDLFFKKKRLVRWESYFKFLDRIYERTLSLLKENIKSKK